MPKKDKERPPTEQEKIEKVKDSICNFMQGQILLGVSLAKFPVTRFVNVIEAGKLGSGHHQDWKADPNIADLYQLGSDHYKDLKDVGPDISDLYQYMKSSVDNMNGTSITREEAQKFRTNFYTQVEKQLKEMEKKESKAQSLEVKNAISETIPLPIKSGGLVALNDFLTEFRKDLERFKESCKNSSLDDDTVSKALTDVATKISGEPLQAQGCIINPISCTIKEARKEPEFSDILQNISRQIWNAVRKLFGKSEIKGKVRLHDKLTDLEISLGLKF